MGLNISLRGDLAKLTDAELAARLESAWQSYEAAERDAKRTRTSLWYSRRGPIRHPFAYRLLSVAGLSGPGFSAYLGLGPFFRFAASQQHLILCEILDLTDEIERRVSQRRDAAK
jgi:hypothetical protein